MKVFKKKLIIVFCVIIILNIIVLGINGFSILFETVDVKASAVSVGDLEYEIRNGEVTITGCDKSASGSLAMPSFIESYPVTSIGESAFEDCVNLTSITISDSVTIIGYNSFSGCTGLTSIDIPNSVTEIDDWAFYSCVGLKRLIIPSSITNIGDEVFTGCSGLVSINVDPLNKVYQSAGDCLIETKNKALILGCKNSIIPDDGSVRYIWNAFEQCTELTSITIPNGIISIGNAAFMNCRELKDVLIPDSVTTIGEGAFYNCIKLKNIMLPNSITSIDAVAFDGCSEDLIISGYGGSVAEKYAKDNNIMFNVIDSDPKPQIPEYTVKFISDGKTISENKLKEGDTITKPTDPVKEGYTFKGWTPEVPEKMSSKDLIFTAAFEKNPSKPDTPVTSFTPEKLAPDIVLKNYRGNLTVDYKSRLVFHVTLSFALPSGYKIVWSNDDEGTECVIESAVEKEYVISAKIVKISDNSTVSTTKQEIVTVNTGFFAKIIALFRSLFGALPEYVDNVRE